MATTPTPAAQGSVLVPVSLGELVDKITILEIKKQHITDAKKAANVAKELQLLSDVLAQQGLAGPEFERLCAELKTVNESLWQIEDDIRDCERKRQFEQRFIDLARAVYITNDKRAALKTEINVRFNSALVEEKSYAAY